MQTVFEDKISKLNAENQTHVLFPIDLQKCHVTIATNHAPIFEEKKIFCLEI